MRSLLLLSLALLLSAPSFGAQRGRDKPVELTDAQRSLLQDVVMPAYQSGNPTAVLSALQPLVKKTNPGQLAAMDAFLKENDVPSIAELVSTARIMLVEQNELAGLPTPQGQELLLTLRGLKVRIDELLKLREAHVVFSDDLKAPVSFREFEHRLWEMHVMENSLQAGIRMGHYGSEWKRGAQRRPPKNLTVEDQELLETDFNWLETELNSMIRELQERTWELRLQRLEFAVERLETSEDLKERFQAAFALDMDGELLSQFYGLSKEAGAVPHGEQIIFRSALADPALPPRIAELIEQGTTAAGAELLQKSRLLFTGLHWWYRGRYGVGPEGYGLLKSAAALKSPEALFGLYMPRAIPSLSTQQTQQAAEPQYPRRHYQLWQFETRNIIISNSSRTTTQSSDSPQSVTHLTHFY